MEKIVFTNGCFDLVHPGHIDLLRRAKALGTRLIVGINSDESVRRIKGPGRPFMKQEDRMAVLKALESVDDVIIFDDLTPEKLIHEIKPDVLVKGGDWKTDEIVGADFVMAKGGEVHSLPLVEGYSSTAYLEKIAPPTQNNFAEGADIISRSLKQHTGVFEDLHDNFRAEIADCARLIIETIGAGNKVLICGNGGSAADAQHIAAEFVGRYEAERRGLPAIALTTDTSALTALSNDYGFDRVFARQVEALGRPGDIALAITTSGHSPNVVKALETANARGLVTIALTGRDGGEAGRLAAIHVNVPENRTALAQEVHTTVLHVWCELIDEEVKE